MLAIPLQRGSSVNVTENFNSLLKTQYSDNAYEVLKSEIASFQSLRDSAVLVFEPTDDGIQTLQRLNFQYTSLVPRLNGYQNELRVSYRWQDGFRTSKSIMTTCLYVDWACFMFNLAALQSKLGSKTERTSVEGIKLANKYFQQSAGIFDYILHKIIPFCTSSSLTSLTTTTTASNNSSNSSTASNTKLSSTPSTISASSNTLLSGLSNAGLTMARDLMLAQAQLCFYEKAVREKKAGNMKAAIVAKLALQTSTYFELVKRSLETEPILSVFDPSWIHHTDYQLANFKAASEYWQAVSAKEIALEKGKGYGEEVIRLIRAEKILWNAIKEGERVNLNTGLIASAEVFYKTIQSNKMKAEHENNTIYMDTIPTEASLTAIIPASMVKPMLTLVTDYSTNEQLLFQRVMPSIVKQYNSSFNTQMESIIMKASTEAGTASNEGRTALSAIGLPGSLEAFKTGGSKLPDNLWNKISQAQLLGLKTELDNKLSTLEGNASRTMQCMANIFGTIQREERIDNDFHAKYNHVNTTSASATTTTATSTNTSSLSPMTSPRRLQSLLILPPSSSMLNNDIRTSLQQMREAFAKAQENDNVVKKQLQDALFLEQLNILSKSCEEISILLNTNTNITTISANNTNTAPALIDFMNDDLTGSNSSSSSNNGNNSNSMTVSATNTSVLESKLFEMVQLIETRGKMLASLEAIGNTDISQELMKKHTNSSNNSSNNDGELLAVINQYIQSTVDPVTVLTNSIQRQPILLQEIITANESFQKACTKDPSVLARNQIIQSLEQSVTKFFNLHAQLSAGITFYTSFQSRLTALQQSSDDLAYTQQLQRQEYEHNLAQEHLRQSQELNDRQYAEKLAQDMQRQLAINGGSPSSSSLAPQYATSSGTENVGNVLNFYPQIPAAVTSTSTANISNAYNNPAYSAYPPQPLHSSSHSSSPHQQQQQQYSPHQAANSSNNVGHMPSPYEVSYGQPVSAPPAAAALAGTQTHSPYTQSGGGGVGSGGYNPTSTPAYYSPLTAPSQQQQLPVPAVHNYQYNQSPTATTATVATATYPIVQNNSNNNNSCNNNQQQQQLDPQLHQKALRLVEMGFSYDNCIHALRANDGDEMNSLNSLLSSSSSSSSSNTANNNNNNNNTGASAVANKPSSSSSSSSTATPPAKPPVPSSGLFGKWGK